MTFKCVAYSLETLSKGPVLQILICVMYSTEMVCKVDSWVFALGGICLHIAGSLLSLSVMFYMRHIFHAARQVPVNYARQEIIDVLTSDISVDSFRTEPTFCRLEKSRCRIDNSFLQLHICRDSEDARNVVKLNFQRAELVCPLEGMWSRNRTLLIISTGT